MNTIKSLIEDYKRRLETVNQMLETNQDSGSINDTKKFERLRTKASEFRTIIAELERTTIDCSDCENVYEVIKLIPQQPQVQYDLKKQLSELRVAANKLGLYDAADYLKPKDE